MKKVNITDFINNDYIFYFDHNNGKSGIANIHAPSFAIAKDIFYEQYTTKNFKIKYIQIRKQLDYGRWIKELKENDRESHLAVLLVILVFIVPYLIIFLCLLLFKHGV